MSESVRTTARVSRPAVLVRDTRTRGCAPQDPVESYMFANTGGDDVPDL